MSHKGIGKGRGRAYLNLVNSIGADGSKNLIYSQGDQLLRNTYQPMTIREVLANMNRDDLGPVLSLDFLTPTRIKYRERLVLELSFPILIRNLLRRFSLLAYFHNNLELKDINFKELINQSEQVKVKERELQWCDWERFSQRQSRRMKLGGFIGRISFSGPWQDFFPYIALGQWLHVGKGTSFGLGHYSIL